MTSQQTSAAGKHWYYFTHVLASFNLAPILSRLLTLATPAPSGRRYYHHPYIQNRSRLGKYCILYKVFCMKVAFGATRRKPIIPMQMDWSFRCFDRNKFRGYFLCVPETWALTAIIKIVGVRREEFRTQINWKWIGARSKNRNNKINKTERL